MTVTTFTNSDAYALIDIPEAPIVIGPVRQAKKVLQRTTQDLARHATYALAAFGVSGAGGAAALNLDPSAADDDSVQAFSGELSRWADRVGFSATGALGIDPDALRGLLRTGSTAAPALAATARGAAGELSGARVIVTTDAIDESLSNELEEASAGSIDCTSDLASAFAAGADVVFVRGSTGCVSHSTVDGIRAGRLVGLQPLTFTARGLAVATRAGVEVVPDFISAAGPVLAATGDKWPPERLRTVAAETTAAAGEHADMFVAAAEAAEANMRKWSERLPFGRPLAP
ncbi:MAG: hypothetical protein ACR2P0_04160 [Acidimicrobiales bacterium]